MTSQLLVLPIFVNPSLSLFHSSLPSLRLTGSVCVCVWDPLGTFAVTQTGVMNSGVKSAYLANITTPFTQKFKNVTFSLKPWDTETDTLCWRTCAHKHTQSCTCTHHIVSSAINPFRLVIGEVCVQGPCPLYWSHWTWGGLLCKGLSSERRHEGNERSAGAGNRLAEDRVGQGETTTETGWAVEVQDTEKRQQPEPIQFYCV